MKVLGYSPWGNANSIEPFNELFPGKPKDCRKDGFDGIDAFVLWGGTDIHPSFYGEQAHPSSQAGALPSDRDAFEWGAIKFCRANNIPIIGVCRGAQMLCAADGGKLVQHCDGHNFGSHLMQTDRGDLLTTNSFHHQMMNPYFDEVEFKLLAWSAEKLSNKYYAHDMKTEYTESKARPEPEVVYFPRLKAIAIQGHPEWSPKEGAFVKQCNQWIKEYLL